MESKTRNLDQITSLIGKYLLTGWVLTDKVCETPTCEIPLLRSKDSSVWFCVFCNELEKSRVTSPPPQLEIEQQQISTDMEINENDIQDILTKAASQLISKYLLMGWALIDEICHNDKCFDVLEIKDICDTIKSCAQALESVMSLERKM
ncbi:5892_t:CDS:2 [Diversispora eburnea]|uniref:5892_t:CDS:1 n=1 Tax=Diversispora eburnea TaxID=1213867 RepID=A0A9N9AUN8_9GLOM|nr:5892_t:CDS:2 [Diversispora eburnea]